MSKPRKKNKGWPQRVYALDGSYKFKPDGKMLDPSDGKMKTWIKLCPLSAGYATMLNALAKLLGDAQVPTDSMPYLCHEFSMRKLGNFSPETQKQYRQFLNLIADDFEEFSVRQVTTKACADFLRSHFKEKANTAQKYAGLMRKVFRYAISGLGLRKDNPIDQLDLEDYKTTRREVLPTHAQIKAIRLAGFTGADKKKTQSGPTFACLIDMSYLCWQRSMDIRELKESQIANGQIHFKPTKTIKSSGKFVDIIITNEIQGVIDRARAIKQSNNIISDYIFPTRKGTPYTRSGLFSMWDRARERAKITNDIIFKDLRALAATDAKRGGVSLNDIQTRLVHTSSKTTEIYIKEAIPVQSNMESELPWK
jgi:integrase